MQGVPSTSEWKKDVNICRLILNLRMIFVFVHVKLSGYKGRDDVSMKASWIFFPFINMNCTLLTAMFLLIKNHLKVMEAIT